MTVKQDTRIRKTQKLNNLESEKARHNLEALCLAYKKNKAINEWRRKAMEFMTTPLWGILDKSSRKYQKIRSRTIDAHEKWIEARGLLEELETSKAYARAIYDMIQWSQIGESILKSAPPHI